MELCRFEGSFCEEHRHQPTGALFYRPALCTVAAQALQQRVEEAEKGYIRTCPPGVCKVQSPQECTCLRSFSEAQSRLASLEAEKRARP